MALRAPTRRLASTFALATGVAVLSTACLTAPRADADRDPYDGHTIEWGPCDSSRTDLDPKVQCGTLALPVDWTDPAGEQYSARVYRQPASGTSRGTILDFPSGPGATADIAFATWRQVAPGYDLIGIDPRGVSDTSAVTCSIESVLSAPMVTPADPAAFERTAESREAVAKSCRTEPAGLLEHLDTHSSARDAEAFRRAAGVGPVVVAGTSFGTLLGARYLELFGDDARGAIFDGVMDPNLTGPEFQRTAARGLQDVFDEFTRWCAKDKACVLRGKDVSAVFAQARRRGAKGTIPGTTLMGRDFDEAGVVQAFEIAAGQDDFPAAAKAIRDMARGKNPNPPEPEGLEAEALGAEGLEVEGPEAAEDSGAEAEADDADGRIPFPDRIVCADYDLGISDAATARTTAAAARRRDIPYSPNAFAYSVLCSGAPKPSAEETAEDAVGGDFPIMLLSHRYDAATPIAWANTVQKRLGDRARHLVVEGVGHGGSTSDPAVRKAVTAYLAGRGA